MKTNRANKSTVTPGRSTVAMAACSFALTAGSEIQLLPAGEFHSVDGRPKDAPCWLMNAQIAARLIADITALANPLVIDYEHQTLLAADNGQPAPAAGWFKSLRWDEGVGLFAQVEWTERATAHIEAGEYRFISPVITYDKSTGAIKKLINAALTNNPAIDGMESVSARLTAEFNQQEKLTMDYKELLETFRYWLNLPTLATQEEILAAVQKAVELIKVGEGDAVAANTLGIVGLTQTRATELVSLRAELNTSTEALTAVQAELTALKQAGLTKQVTDLVEAALSAHKISPAQKSAMLDLGNKDLSLLSRVLESAVPIVAKGEVAPADNKEALTSDYSAPSGYHVDADQVALLSQAKAYMTEKNCDFITAYKAIGGK